MTEKARITTNRHTDIIRTVWRILWATSKNANKQNMAFLTKEEFALFRQYGDKYAQDFPEAHEKLRNLYDKLGEISWALSSYGYKTHIRRNPQNQGQKYEKYHWAQLTPSYSPDSEGIIFFVISLGLPTFGVIDLNCCLSTYRAVCINYYITDNQYRSIHGS